MLETRTSPWTWFDWTFVSAATALAAVARFYALDRKSFWFDEGVSVAISRLDWYNFARLLWRREANMSLYYLLLRGWQHIAHSEAGIRSLSVIFALATVLAIYWLGLRLFGRRVAAMATLLFTVNAYNIRYAQEARSYSLYVLLATLSLVTLVEYLDRPVAGTRRLYIASSALAVYAHFYFAFLIVAEWLALRLRAQVPAGLNRTFRWIAGLTFPAFLFAATTGVGPLRWVPRPDLKEVYLYYAHMSGNGGVWLFGACLIAIVGALLPCGRVLWQRNSTPDVWRRQLLLIVLLFPLVLIFLLSYARPLFVPRYLIACQPAFLILVVAGVDRLPRWWLRSSAVVLLVALSVRGTLSYYQHDFDLDRDDYRAASYYLLDHTRPGDAVVFNTAQARMPYEFYRSLYRGPGQPPTVIYPYRGEGLNYRDFLGKPSVDFLQSVPAKHKRVWVIMKFNGTTADPDPTTHELSKVFGGAYANMEEKVFPGVIVRLYSRPQT